MRMAMQNQHLIRQSCDPFRARTPSPSILIKISFLDSTYSAGLNLVELK